MTELRNAKRLFGALAVAAGVAMAGTATADQITLNDPANLGGYPGPYATVTYSLVDSNTATFTYTALGSFLLFGVNTAALNFNLDGGTGVSLATISGDSNCNAPYSSGGAGNVGGQGNFNFRINTFNGVNCGSTSLTFTVDLLGVGASWANTADILAPNNLGNLAAAHVAAGCTGSYPNIACVFTGFAGGDTSVPPNEVPEPQTLALLGLGLLGLALSRRRRMR